jgi:antitoxin component YwqK of YwqJK toxin-antitoxin module
MKKLVFIFLLFAIINNTAAQTFNQFDDEGKRHGVWLKFFEDSNVKRYEGRFNHGKEVGVFKFYKNVKGKAVLSATRQFNDSTDIAEVKFFTSKGKVVSEGNMRGKTYVGTWKYYQKNSDKLLTLEFYNDKGQLSGKRFVYYDNEQVAEETNYKEGLLHGAAINYTLNGIVLKTLFYVAGELHGDAKFYNPKGELLVEGHYKKGKKHGVWNYYDNGELKDTKNFTVQGKYKP